MKDKMILEEGMQYTHKHVEDVLYIFNPWNGALLMTMRGMSKELVHYIMHDLNAGTRHIHSTWVWHGSHGVHVPVIR